jgi:sulfur carrier protein ThiS
MPRVVFHYEGDQYETDVAPETEISDALEQVDINPQTVVIKHDNTVQPHRAPIEQDQEFELVRVVSGG